MNLCMLNNKSYIMHTSHAILITLSVLFIGFITLYNIIQLVQILMNKKFSVRSLFFNFKQKMWMTIILGVLFFGFYALILFFGSLKLDSKTKLDLFFNVYQNPLNYIYLGLSIFVTLTVSIYLTRMFIIYLYNSKKR